jgi:predicted phage terminase large subunit-like protein
MGISLMFDDDDEPVKKTVVEWLNEVDYSNDSGYIPSDFSLEFVNFIKLVSGDKPEEHATPVVHYRMLDQVPGSKQNIVNMCARGLSKTTVMAQYLILYIAVYGEIPGYGNVDYALYVSDAIENGVKKMRLRLERLCENSEFLKRYLEVAKFTDVRWYFKNVEGDELVVTGHGAQSGVRGTVELGTRPQLALLDDLLSDSDAKSPTVIASIEETVYKAIDFALHPSKRKIIWSGTPFNAKDPLYKAVESGAWCVNVYPICNEYPCTEENYHGAWPDRFPYAYVKAKYDKLLKLGKVDAFNQELMLRIMSDEDRLILDSDICWYSRDSVLRNRSAFNFYITTDFATSEKKASDFSVISVWALNNKGYWFWVDGVCEKQLMNANIDALFRLAQKYNPQSVGIEVSGQQGGFIPWIQSQMMDRNIWFNLASEGNTGKPGIRPNTNKMVRFNIVVPWFKANHMFFPQEMKNDPIMQEMYNELSLVAPGGFKSKFDDFIDTISMLGSLTVWRPSEITEVNKKDNDIWELDEDKEINDRLHSYIV